MTSKPLNTNLNKLLIVVSKHFPSKGLNQKQGYLKNIVPSQMCHLCIINNKIQS